MNKLYKKDLPYSFTLGTSATLEVLECYPQYVNKIYIHSKLIKNDISLRLLQLASDHQIPFIENDRIGEKLSNKENCFILSEFTKYTEILDPNTNHLLLVNPADAGNLGTIIRSMSGFGFSNLAIITPSVDHFSPKTIRASMGAIFKIKIALFSSFDEYQRHFKGHHLYPFMLNATHNLASLIPKEPYSLIFGNEATGLPQGFSNIGECVQIYHTQDIDSLNLPIAVSIALYEMTKKYFICNLNA